MVGMGILPVDETAGMTVPLKPADIHAVPVFWQNMDDHAGTPLHQVGVAVLT